MSSFVRDAKKWWNRHVHGRASKSRVRLLDNQCRLIVQMRSGLRKPSCNRDFGSGRSRDLTRKNKWYALIPHWMAPPSARLLSAINRRYFLRYSTTLHVRTKAAPTLKADMPVMRGRNKYWSVQRCLRYSRACTSPLLRISRVYREQSGCASTDTLWSNSAQTRLTIFTVLAPKRIRLIVLFR